MKAILFAVLVTSVAACVEEEAPLGYGDGLGTAANPIPKEGAYDVVSRIDFSVEMPQIALLLGDLRAFSQNPGRALLAQANATPAMQELTGALSVTLRDRLEGWINTEIDKVRISGKTVRQYASEVVAISETSLTQFKLESSLSIMPTGVMHSLKTLNFIPANLDILIPIGGLKADSLSQRTTAIVGDGGELTFGEQRFGLAFGNHAWQGINLASTTLFGSDLRTTLVSALGCRTLGQVVATKCYSTSCVGHAAQLQAVCESGIDTIVGELRDQVLALQLHELRFVAGSAHMVDTNRDGIGEGIVDGRWTIETDYGFGLRAAPATFTATR